MLLADLSVSIQYGMKTTGCAQSFWENWPWRQFLHADMWVMLGMARVGLARKIERGELKSAFGSAKCYFYSPPSTL